ncbi:MAG: phytanoyl-CoA dioxygenase family protein [Hyphomicrobiaceae bacterium TMED74]|nr:phytanoyl-CoA dioxygenase [Filomicrobium sp.]RPG48305.1 MAG: phytanoyl-CoA dioxygenase family protein [Hyphomicrobiaceae bacterium TMED74]
MLSRAEIETYHCDGYVIPEGFQFKDTELAELRDGLNAVLAQNPDIMPDRLMNPHLNQGKPYGVCGHAAFHRLAHDPRIIDMAEAGMGPDLILLFTHLFCKPAESARVVPWHQDGPFWPVTPMKSCTIWLALDDVDEANGAMKVIPGSHRRDAIEHNLTDDSNSTLNRELPVDDVDESKAQLIGLKAGQVSLHDIGIIHGSAANTSGRRRAGLALRYMPSTSCMYRVMPNAAASWGDMPMELVRGANRNERNDFSLGDFGQPWPSA